MTFRTSSLFAFNWVFLDCVIYTERSMRGVPPQPPAHFLTTGTTSFHFLLSHCYFSFFSSLLHLQPKIVEENLTYAELDLVKPIPEAKASCTGTVYAQILFGEQQLWETANRVLCKKYCIYSLYYFVFRWLGKGQLCNVSQLLYIGFYTFFLLAFRIKWNVF